MRSFLNAILSFISESALTDDEFDAIEADLGAAAYNSVTYEALAALLTARGSVYQDRLTNYFLAKGVSVTAVTTGQSNILIGGVLCE